ncbi:hypothetical protein [Vibrio sp. MA40-2]|uniref:aldose epimerase family protein n=1 Tax=Vibrio sp. MA40-2 TaxID=3391828 RepID=UPI0039A4EE86
MEFRKYNLRHPSGIHATILNYGARLHEFGVAKGHNIVVPMSSTSEYLTCTGYQNATIGPLANIVRDGEILLTNKSVQLDKNYGSHSLHSGKDGYDKKFWTLVFYQDCVLKLMLTDSNRLNNEVIFVYVIFELTSAGLNITYEADSNTEMWMNMTNHCYFNLVGEKNIYNHWIFVNANQVVDTDKDNIPMPTVSNIEDENERLLELKVLATTKSSVISKRLKKNSGFNHCYLLNKTKEHAVVLSHSSAKANLAIITTKPALQLYTTNHPTALGNSISTVHGAVCLEPMYPTNDYFKQEEALSYIPFGKKYRETDSYHFI